MNDNENTTSAALMSLVDFANRSASRLVTTINPDLTGKEKSIAFHVGGSDLEVEIFTAPEEKVIYFKDGQKISETRWFELVNTAN